METSVITPPFGLSLFVMKGVAPQGTTLGEIYWAVLPFVALNVLAIAIIFILPGTVSWLPGLMK
jgi:TRAP-type mannitol/chloroaromatic compound transport system permease large subunit